jgi:hypothetical protein
MHGSQRVLSRCAGPLVESQARGTCRCLVSPRSRPLAIVPHPPSSRAALSRLAGRARPAGHGRLFALEARRRDRRPASRRRLRSRLRPIDRRRQHVRTGPHPRRCVRRASTPTKPRVDDRQLASSGRAFFRSSSLWARKTASSANVARASTPPTRMSHGQSRAKVECERRAHRQARNPEDVVWGESAWGKSICWYGHLFRGNIPCCLDRPGLRVRTLVSPKAVVADDAVLGVAARARAPRRLLRRSAQSRSRSPSAGGQRLVRARCRGCCRSRRSGRTRRRGTR